MTAIDHEVNFFIDNQKGEFDHIPDQALTATCYPLPASPTYLFTCLPMFTFSQNLTRSQEALTHHSLLLMFLILREGAITFISVNGIFATIFPLQGRYG